MMKESYDKAMEKREKKIEFESWCEETTLQNPLFRYWYIAYNMELTILSFLKSIRGKHFEIYLSSIEEIRKWMFSLDRTH